jgi:hypothetical protein
LHSFRVAVYLEQEEDVVPIKLRVVSLNELVDLSFKVLVIGHQLSHVDGVLIHLSLVEIALEESVVQVDGSEFVEDVSVSLPNILYYELEIVFELVNIIHKYLQKVFYSDSLILLNLKLLVWLRDKLLLLGVLSQCSRDFFDYLLDLV